MELMQEIAGWCGGVMVGLAYALVSTGRIHAQTRTFQLLNVAGGALLTWTALHHGALSNAVIDLVWVVFGIYALVVIRTRGHQDADAHPQPLSAGPSSQATIADASPTEQMTAA